jgi:hypothetical protein
MASTTNTTAAVFKTYLSAAATTLLCGGLAAGIVFGRAPLERRAASVIDTGSLDLRITWPVAAGGKSTWMPRASAEQLTMIAHDAAGASSEVLDAEQLSRISTALSQTGWFIKPPLVKRPSANVITVDGEWRIPAANIRFNNETFLIAWDGHPLPPGVEAGRWIYDPVLGPPRDTAGERDYSQPWGGEDVAASLELLGRVEQEPWASQVRGIDASQFSREGVLVIITDRNTKVVWGGRPSKPALGEVSTAQKMQHLRQLVKDTRRIDASYPLIYINQDRLQFDISATAMARRPTSQDDAGEGK